MHIQIVKTWNGIMYSLFFNCLLYLTVKYKWNSVLYIYIYIYIIVAPAIIYLTAILLFFHLFLLVGS